DNSGPPRTSDQRSPMKAPAKAERTNWSSETSAMETPERGFWKSTMAIAGAALQSATRVQQAVGLSLKLQHKIRGLRAELHKAEAERDIYRELHARASRELQRATDTSPVEWKRQRAEIEALQIR